MATKTEFGGPDGRRGSTLASTTLKPFTPRTLNLIRIIAVEVKIPAIFVFILKFKPELRINHCIWVVFVSHGSRSSWMEKSANVLELPMRGRNLCLKALHLV